ncbi:MAG: type II secretion system protein E [Chloroflexi bacterium]|nr:type II secretion system protein E [Chloroflexota bacterium]
MVSFRQPFAWSGPGTRWDEESALSILHLIENHTLDAATAALLWLFVERKASLIVAAPPRLAGKTTMLTALIGLRRPDVQLAYTRGQQEDFSFLREMEPSKTYILCNEISPHLPTYLWGERVLTLFQSVARGYSLGSTMHADSPQEVVDDLRHAEVAVPPELLRHLALVVNLETGYTRSGILRRVREVWMQEADTQSNSLSFRAIAQWEPGNDSFVVDTSPSGVEALRNRLGLQGDLEAELRRHQQALEAWLKEGVRGYGDVRKRVAAFMRGSSA